MACDRLHLFCACIRRSDEKLKELFSQSRWTTVVLEIFFPATEKKSGPKTSKKDVYDSISFPVISGNLNLFLKLAMLPMLLALHHHWTFGTFPLRIPKVGNGKKSSNATQISWYSEKTSLTCRSQLVISTFWAVVQNLGQKSIKTDRKKWFKTHVYPRYHSFMCSITQKSRLSRPYHRCIWS